MKLSFTLVLNKEEVNAYKSFAKNTTATLVEVLGGDAPSVDFEEFFKDIEVKMESTSLFGKMAFALNMKDTIEYNVSIDLGTEAFTRYLEIQTAIVNLVKFWPQLKPIVDQIKVIMQMMADYDKGHNPTSIEVYTSEEGEQKSVAAEKLNAALSM